MSDKEEEEKEEMEEKEECVEVKVVGEMMLKYYCHMSMINKQKKNEMWRQRVRDEDENMKRRRDKNKTTMRKGERYTGVGVRRKKGKIHRRGGGRGGGQGWGGLKVRDLLQVSGKLYFCPSWQT